MSNKDSIHKAMMEMALRPSVLDERGVAVMQALALVLIANAMHVPTLGVPAANQPEAEEPPEDKLLHAPDGSVMGFLLDAGHGIFEPNLGKVAITQEGAAAHNRALSRTQIKGLEDCKIGEGGTFYYDEKAGTVSTWVGEEVSRDVEVTLHKKKLTITFRFGGMKFEGETMMGEPCFPFRRIS